jgi:uroporphyrinogen-III synthase
VPLTPGFEKLIFTSKNGVRAFLKLLGNKFSEGGKQQCECYCVGNKTAGLLRKNGFRVKVSKPGSLELARYIIDHDDRQTYLYCCGNLRRKELPNLLREHTVQLKELVVYETILNPVRVDGTFDAVLFFSPTAVVSFFNKNALGGATAWCIGPTTASEVKKYTDRFNFSPVPDTKTLITMMIKALGQKTKQPK